MGRLDRERERERDRERERKKYIHILTDRQTDRHRQTAH
jgi:hypothetical protein